MEAMSDGQRKVSWLQSCPLAVLAEATGVDVHKGTSPPTTPPTFPCLPPALAVVRGGRERPCVRVLRLFFPLRRQLLWHHKGCWRRWCFLQSLALMACLLPLFAVFGQA